MTCDLLPAPRLGHACNSWGRSGILSASRRPSSLSSCDSYGHQLPLLFLLVGDQSSQDYIKFDPEMEAEFVLRYDPITEDVIQVAWVTFFKFSLDKWLGIPSRTTNWLERFMASVTCTAATSPRFSLFFASAFLFVSVAFYWCLDRKGNWLIKIK